jgi:hypothetical protein
MESLRLSRPAKILQGTSIFSLDFGYGFDADVGSIGEEILQWKIATKFGVACGVLIW